MKFAAQRTISEISLDMPKPLRAPKIIVWVLASEKKLLGYGGSSQSHLTADDSKIALQNDTKLSPGVNLRQILTCEANVIVTGGEESQSDLLNQLDL